MKGLTSWSDIRAIGHKFTQLEEESIQDLVISMDNRGAALTIVILRDMANLLLENRGNLPPPPRPLVRIGRHSTLNDILSFLVDSLADMTVNAP